MPPTERGCASEVRGETYALTSSLGSLGLAGSVWGTSEDAGGYKRLTPYRGITVIYFRDGKLCA